MRGNRNLRTILLALLLAAASALIAYLLISPRQGGDQSGPTPTPAPQTQAVVAGRDLAAGTLLAADDLGVATVPRDTLDPSAVLDPAKATGRMLANDLAKGAPVLTSDLIDVPEAGDPTFAKQVPVGMRAMSLQFDEVLGVGGLAQPGDHVDVVVSLTDAAALQAPAGTPEAVPARGQAEPTKAPPQRMSGFVVQDVEVLAVGQALSPGDSAAPGQGVAPPPPPEGGPPTTVTPVPKPLATSVTLLLTPDDALRLMLADEVRQEGLARLRLVLRAPGDAAADAIRPAQTDHGVLSDRLPGDLGQALVPDRLRIVDATFREAVVPAGGLVEFEATVVNASTETIPAGAAADPVSGYVYQPGATWQSAGGPAAPGSVAVALTAEGDRPAYPYRWFLERDLRPGETATVSGAVRLGNDPGITRYWLGVVETPDLVLEDGVAVTTIVVRPAAEVTVIVDHAPLRAEPWPDAPVLSTLSEGTQLPVQVVRDGWFLVSRGSRDGWISERYAENSALQQPSPEATATPRPAGERP